MTFLKLSFSAGLVYWLISTDRFKLSELENFLTPPNLLIAFILVGLGLLIMTERWRGLIQSQGYSLSRLEIIRLNLIGLFFNFAVPGGVGGDVIKAHYLQKDLQIPRAVSYSSALMDRISGLYTFVLLALSGLIFEIFYLKVSNSTLNQLLFWVCFIFLGMTTFFVGLKYFKTTELQMSDSGIKGKFFRFSFACKGFVQNPKILLIAIFTTVLAQSTTLLFFNWFIETVMNETVSGPLLFFVVPLGFMLMAIPITPAGVGVGQAAFYFLFHTFSEGKINSGSSVITAFQLMLFAWGLVGSYFYLTKKNRSHISAEI